MTAASEEVNNEVASTPGVGYRLQQARERKKLSIADTASQLRFTRDTVVHLEQEAWDKLHSRIYARGYLLSYAKFLGLPSDDMLSAFNAQYGEAERPSSLLVTKTFPIEKPFPWRSSLLMVIVIIVAGLAYQYWPKQGLQPVQSSVPEVPDSSMQSPLETVPEANLPDNDMAIRANPQYAQDTRDVSKLNQSLATPLMIESMPANMASSEQLSQTESTLQSPEIKAAESMPVKSEEVPVESAASAPADDGQITLVVTEASWIEVKDKTGNKLISRVLEQETVDLTGSPPLAVRIGNVAGTSLRFNEKPVDLKAYQQNNIARLTLGAES